MSESTLKPFNGKLDDNTNAEQKTNLKTFTGALDGKEKGFLGQTKDLGISLIPKGLAGVAELGIGLSNMMSDGATGKILQDKGVYNAKAVRDELNTWHTDQYQEQLKQKANIQKQEIKEDDSLSTQAGKLFDNTKEYLKFYKENPSMIANTVAESIAPMVAGGLLGRATGIANPIAAGAVGEGTVMAGSQAEQIRQETVDGRLTADQSLAGATTGVLGGLIGFAGGRLAQKMGIGDVDTMLVTGRAGPAEIAGEIASMPAKSLSRRVVEGAISEGFLEELPQSVSEQILQNLALDKPWHDGIEDAAVMGTLAGMAMGGVANIPSGHTNNAQADNNNIQTESNPTSPLPQLGGPSMEGEYIPRGASEQNSANVNQTNYEYTQFDSDASNRLDNNGFGSTDTGNVPTDPVQPDLGGGSYFDSQKPSERLGLNPDNGPMSSAAALAVDSGASTSATSMGDASSATSSTEQENAKTYFSDNNTAQAIQYGMGEIAQGAKEAALENTIQRLEKDGEVQLFKEDSIAKALEDNNYNVRLNNDGSASIIGVKNPSTNEWHGTERTDSSTPALNMADTQDQSSESNTSQQLATLQQRFDEAKTVPEKAKIRKEINQLQNNQLQPDVNSNDKFQSTDVPEIRNSEVPDSTGNQLTSTSNSPTNDVENVPNEKASKPSQISNVVTNQINQLEQKLSAAKSVPQKAKIRNQINQLKSQQIESRETPQNVVLNPDQIKTQYGDAPESVMSDIEILGDDFTVDLREDNKKANALNNPNYNAVQKSDGSVEIVGMKHPTTGEWVGKKPTAVSIDENAHQAATSAQNNTPEPTQAQIEAGNYKKGHIKVQGLDISIENPKGSERRGTDPNGKEWAHTMSDHYGYIKKTTGADNEQIDTYVGNNPESDQVFIVDQIDQETGNFDEHKVMLGFNSLEEATTAYKSNFDQGWKVGPIRNMDMEQFKDWLKNSDTTKPAGKMEKNDKPQPKSKNILGVEVEKRQSTKPTNNYSSKESNQKISIQSDSEIRQTHFIPSFLVDQPHKIADVVNELASMRTEGVKANVPYAINLLRSIAKLNPNAQIHIVSDLNKIKDKAIRAGLTDGGFFVPEQNTSYIYPKSEAWNSSVLELLNHELVHSVTGQSIADKNVSQKNLDKLRDFRENISTYIKSDYKTIHPDILDRLYYVVNDEYFNEMLAVGTSESSVREVLKKPLGTDGLKQLDAIFTEISTNQYKESGNEQKQGGNPQGQQSENLKRVSSTTTTNSESDSTDSTTNPRSQDTDGIVGGLEQATQSGNINDSSKDTNTKPNQSTPQKNDSDKPLYSRRTENKAGSTVKQVRDVLIERFGKDTINELERQGKLEIIQDYSVDGVEGFYYNGKAVLVASNLTNESTIPTFLHELGGHAGFQNMMTQKQYNELMNQFNKLVDQGNPVAMAAKLLAEREQGSERQQLEYLPYLLTLSATMQQRNMLQRNALQKLINNIISYVKAWVFDHFGINLNLNPDDMLALSERMIGQIKHQSSLDLIRQKYHGTDKWMTAPNGAKTHLSEQQWLQVRTPEFKKWFGDWENDAANASQVLDENGEPKVVYHGTATEFNEFKQGHGLLGDGIYLTDSFDTADVYANIRGENGFVLPLFVNIRNAFKTTGNVSRDEFVEATTSGKYQGIVHQFENQEYIVALEPNQVKMAEGNTGTFNSESSDIRFSRSSNYDDITKRIANGFKNLPKTGDWINKKGVDWLKIGLGLLSRRHLTEVYGKLLPPLNKYNELAAQMDADKNDIAANADNIVREWSKLKDEEALANVMHDATLAQIDPAKPYQQGDNKVKYQQLIHAYNNLSPEAQAMYKKARNAYSGHYAKVREAIRERILRSALSSQKKADLLKNIEGSFGQIKGVYFPLARFGKYVVVLRNQNGEAEVVSRAETKNEAESVRAELIKKYPQYKADDVKKDADFNASRDSVGRGFMSDLFDEVGNLGLDKNAQADFEDTLSQLYLSSMPDLSWAKHGIHRKGTAGFSQDARRAFAQHMFSGANYLGKLRYGDQLAQQIDDMKKYSNEQFNKGIGYDQNSASDVIDEMEKRHELLMNPKGNPLSSFLTSVGFMYYMGLSPAAAMVNLSQTALIAYPLMGAKWNYDKAGKELLKASKDFAKGVEFNVPDFSSLESFKNSIGDVYSPNIDKVIKGLELDAYNEAVKRGVIDVTQAHDLAGIAQGEDSKVMWYFRPAMRLASGMFHHAERFNREVTFIAAYRLASQAGATQTEAFEQAMDMVYRGHFDYSSGNRARYMQGNVAKVLLLFKQYAQNMIYTLVRNAHQSIYALDPKDQKEARRALAGILGMHALAAGAIGLPITGMLATASLLIAKKSKLGAVAFGVAALAALASGGDDDDPYELEIVIRNWLSDIHPKFADLVFGGVPRAFSPVDLSGRVGLNNLIIPDVQDGLEGADWAKAMQSALLGPVVGISTNAVKGMQEINNGDYGRGIETMLPVVLKNAMKSMRFANEGVLTRNKDVIQEEVGTVGLFSQAIGFSPSDVKTSMEGRSAIYDYKTKLENHRKDLMRQWVVAKRDDDSEGMDKAWAEILKFNENVSEKNPSMRIKRINLMQSYKSNERRSKDTGDGGVYLTKRQKGAEEQGGFAFKH